MKTLIVGGTGFAGGYTATHMRDLGYDVTVMSRNRAPGTSPMYELPYVEGNYVTDNFEDSRLEGFEALVFCAGADIKYYPQDGSISLEHFFRQANTEAIPRFFELARAAGIRRAVYLGSFYPQVAPDRIASDPYVRSRHEADEAIRRMSSTTFNVCSCNAPYILGYVPGLSVPHLRALARYAAGHIPGAPMFAPPGGTNHMTCKSVAEALVGGLERGDSGKAYLIGDANLSWKEYFERWCQAAGNPLEMEVRDDDHPIVPRTIMYAGDGAHIQYEPPSSETALLGYSQGVLQSMIPEACAHYLSAAD